MKVYLSGIINGVITADIKQNIEFLIQLNHKIVNSGTFKTNGDCKVEKDSNIKKRISKMLTADKVISLSDWHMSDIACKEIEVARTIGMEVLHFTQIATLPQAAKKIANSHYSSNNNHIYINDQTNHHRQSK